MDTVIWKQILYGHRVLKLDSMLNNLSPYSLKDYLIFSIYDPFRLCNLSAGLIEDLRKIGFLEDKNIESKSQNIFDNSWLATKIMRYIFTNNTYVYTAKGYFTSATGIIPIDLSVCKDMLEICEHMKLCCTIYSYKPLEGFNRINLNVEPENYKDLTNKPNHLTVMSSPFYQSSKIKVFRDWYVMCYKYELIYTEIDETIKWTKSFLQWSWLKFLLPICANVNVINVNELVVELIRNLKRRLKVDISLKTILNALKCYPVQLAGTTNMILFGQKLCGKEIPFRNFRYIFNNSIIQWFHAPTILEFELLQCYSYENDWIVNELQRNVLQVFLYCNYDELKVKGFPYNIRTLWNNNQKKILYREKKFDLRKSEFLAQIIRMMDEVT